MVTSAFTCTANSFWVTLVCSWWFSCRTLSFFPTIDASSSEMTRTSSGPASAHHRMASGSCVSPMIPHLPSLIHYYAHPHVKSNKGEPPVGLCHDKLAILKLSCNLRMSTLQSTHLSHKLASSRHNVCDSNSRTNFVKLSRYKMKLPVCSDCMYAKGSNFNFKLAYQ